MPIGGVKQWVGADMMLAGSAEAKTVPPPVAPPRNGRWSPSRIGAVEALWGAGFAAPGGAKEIVRLVTPMGLTQSHTLLLLGGGMGGPAAAIATRYGAWVESFEADGELVAIAEQRRQAQPELRRVAVAPWDRDAPSFKPRSAHHALALEPLRGAKLSPVLSGMAGALRPHGHIVMTELVADEGTPENDREFSAWCRLENRSPNLPREEAVNKALQKLGFDVRVVEDLSERHVAATLSGWQAAVKAMSDGPRPEPAMAAIFVTEAELWLLRIRLMRRLGFRLLRWHAIGTA